MVAKHGPFIKNMWNSWEPLNIVTSDQYSVLNGAILSQNEEVLERANVLDIEIKLLKKRLRWMGHICRINDTRPVKALLFGELEGSRKVGRPLLRYKDTCKMALKRSEVLNEWNAVVNDRDKWKALIQKVCKVHNQKRKADYEERRQKRHKC